VNLVLVHPEIPHNAGAAGRLALATGSTLHLVKPLGFSLEDKHLRRVGLDYWEEVDLVLWDSLEELLAARPPGAEAWYLSTKGRRAHWDARFGAKDYLVLGAESRGLPGSLLAGQPDRVLRIPMEERGVRSLNLATAGAIVLYEAMRQMNGSPGSGAA
jgi:tRNA (cytidine/uridine-2'-O-)-methyltransferase